MFSRVPLIFKIFKMDGIDNSSDEIIKSYVVSLMFNEHREHRRQIPAIAEDKY